MANRSMPFPEPALLSYDDRLMLLAAIAAAPPDIVPDEAVGELAERIRRLPYLPAQATAS